MYSVYAIAEELGLAVPAVHGAIKRLLKSRQTIDCDGGEVIGKHISPTLFGEEVLLALAFQFDTAESERIRKEIMVKREVSPRTFISLPNPDTPLT